jgi:hypothetical protein
VLRDDTYNLALGGCDGAARGMAWKNNPMYGKTHPKELLEKY